MKSELHGHLAGLSAQAVRSLERLYRRKVAEKQLFSPELARHLVDATQLAKRQVGVMVQRSGEISHVLLGDAHKIDLPDLGRHRAAEGRFRGLRLIHTHPQGEPLSKDDIVDLVRLRLDLVAALSLDAEGQFARLSYAYNAPGVPGQLPYRALYDLPPEVPQLHVAQLLAELEAQLSRQRRGRTVQAKDGRAILLHVATNERGARSRTAAEASLRELEELARTAGVEVVARELQLRDRLDARYVVGRGKLIDIVLQAAELDADVLVLDRNLSPAQAAALAKLTDMRVIDRTQLILDIFAQRASSKDGKLQVELAQLKYTLPRLGQRDDSLSRLTGGIGGRGPGETKLEIGRRRARERVTQLEAQLRALTRERAARRRKRQRAAMPRIAIIGYTNAGKSTLLAALTRADVLIENKLFATLETRTKILQPGHLNYDGPAALITDTVGFIRDLPEDLLAAFRATFEEAADADLLLHVIDSTDADFLSHISTTDDLVKSLDLSHIPRLLLFNKWQSASAEQRSACVRAEPHALRLSALDRSTLPPLLTQIAAQLRPQPSHA